jgi:glycerate kinase
LLDVVAELPVPTLAACDVTATLLEAPRVFGPQKGADAEAVAELERRFGGRDDLAAALRHARFGGAAGGLGAALASLGAELVAGAPYVLDAIGFDPHGFDLVVTGEGRIDATTALGKAPGEVVRRSGATPCVVVGGVVDADVPGAVTLALSGAPSRAREDLVAAGRELAASR